MIIEIRNMVKRYQDKVAVNNLSLSIQEGDIFGLLGPNGAGKSTTINSICGLTKVDGGEIKILGKSMATDEAEIKRNMGVVPQEISVIEGLTAYENVTFFGKLYGLKGAELKSKVQEALEFVGLWDRRNDAPKKYSGGMQRRLNIACAIVHQPKIIIMDEPTVGVDPQSRNHILDSVRELNRRGSTIIYTSHYMEEIEEICNRIAIVDHGEVIADGTKDELKQQVINDERLYIEVAAASEAIVNDIKQVAGVKDCTLEENQLKVISDKGSHSLGRLIDTLTHRNAEIVSIDVEKPSLETVFLTLTGRKLRD